MTGTRRAAQQDRGRPTPARLGVCKARAWLSVGWDQTSWCGSMAHERHRTCTHPKTQLGGLLQAPLHTHHTHSWGGRASSAAGGDSHLRPSRIMDEGGFGCLVMRSSSLGDTLKGKSTWRRHSIVRCCAATCKCRSAGECVRVSYECRCDDVQGRNSGRFTLRMGRSRVRETHRRVARTCDPAPTAPRCAPRGVCAFPKPWGETSGSETDTAVVSLHQKCSGPWSEVWSDAHCSAGPHSDRLFHT